ncbi:hypothetical protein [Chenggangzhangella methanolivorans]|uniref:Uncharacterized protein n=1 Tax=Chenggangzhangella methanolivorans TaxID=1437009 RepID=A0A9E6R8L6_9HYPH|nr:hypothetical protein [Chenggangzhangella methanolivorans]QZN99501.1 hypothetical protein K6K41_22775 [Chenggangzhangella methanolivorans]
MSDAPTADPRMSLTLKDRTLYGSNPDREAELARRALRAAEADYLGWPAPAAAPGPITDDQWADEIAAGVAAGLKARAGGRR